LSEAAYSNAWIRELDR